MPRRRPTRALPGGRRTPSALTRRLSGTWTGRCGTTSSRGRASGRAGGSGSRSSKSAASAGLVPAHRRHALRPRDRDASPPRHAEDPRADGQARPEDRQRRRAHPVGHGVTDSSAVVRIFHRPSRAGRAGRHARPGTAVGVDLGVKTLLTGADDRGRLIEVAGPKSLRAACASCAARPARTHANNPGPRDGEKAPRGSPASTPASPTSAPTRSTRPPPRWRPDTRPWSWRT